MEFKVGSRWRSAVCSAEVVVVRPPTSAAVLTCGGEPMIAPGGPAPAAVASAGGALIGKRYYDEASGLEVLCNKGGAGELAVDGRPMLIRETKKLPASD